MWKPTDIITKALDLPRIKTTASLKKLTKIGILYQADEHGNSGYSLNDIGIQIVAEM